MSECEGCCVYHGEDEPSTPNLGLTVLWLGVILLCAGVASMFVTV